MEILIGTERINTAKQESYILQTNWKCCAGRADEFVTAGSGTPGGLGAGLWL